MTTAQDGGKVVNLTDRPPLPPGNTPGTHFCYRLSRPQGHSGIGRIMSMKNSNDTIWDRTSDLPICSTALCYRGPLHDSSSSLVICQTTGTEPLPKWFLHTVRSRASSFNWQYPLLSLRSSSSFLRLLPRLLVTSICPYKRFKNIQYSFSSQKTSLCVT